MDYKKVITYGILIVFGFIMFYLSGIYGLLDFILSLCVYTLIFYFFHYIYVNIRKKELMYFGDFANYFLYRVSIFLVVVTSVIGGFAYYFNEISPAPMPEITLSNGEKVVKFQAMVHIGTKEFYNQVTQNLTNFKKDGGVYFFEGVKPGTPESAEKFNNAMGIQFDENLYKNFSKLYGVTNQDNSIFLGLVNNLDFNVDLNMDEIVKLYEEKIESKPEGEKEYETKLPLDANKTILETLSKLNNRQLKVLVYVNQAILNFIISSEETQSLLTDNFANKDLFDVILGKRNEILANEIINSKYNKIYITYGLLHFDGVFNLLKQNDSKWKIIKTKNLYPIKN